MRDGDEAASLLLLGVPVAVARRAGVAQAAQPLAVLLAAVGWIKLGRTTAVRSIEVLAFALQSGALPYGYLSLTNKVLAISSYYYFCCLFL